MNLADLLRSSATTSPRKTALVVASTDATMTFAELDADVDRIAAALQARGLSKGDRVALALPNTAEFVISYFAVLRAGGVVIPFNVMLTAPEMRRILADAQARFAIAADPYLEAVRAAAAHEGDVEIISVAAWDSLGQTGSRPDEPSTEPDDLAILAYTSGTTGEPKGAMLTHGNLLANLQQQMDIPDDTVGPDDILLLSLPMFHIFGLNVPLGLLVRNGATGVVVERFVPVDALRIIDRYKPTVMFGAPPLYTALVETPGADQYDLSSVRLAISGAAPLAEETLKAFYETFGVHIYEGYGLTETAPTLTTNRMTGDPRPGSVGKPLPGIELKILDEEGNPVEFGDPGEIVVRGPNVFAGYWNKPDETSKVLRDGWFYTGDVGVADEEGYIYLVDRKRDLIIVSGFNVFPSEVEAALVENPIVKEAAVVGVKHPYTGEAVKAYVVLQPGEKAPESELMADIQTRLARFKCPGSIEIVDELPHLPTGKVLKRALRT